MKASRPFLEQDFVSSIEKLTLHVYSAASNRSFRDPRRYFRGNFILCRHPDHGETLVKRWCAACHLVAADQKAATTEAPAFAYVAKGPDFDTAKIASFLLDPHPKMPNMELSRDEAADITAYIATLK